jgi:hypothetical protein
MHWLEFKATDYHWLLAALLTPLCGYVINLFLGKR